MNVSPIPKISGVVNNFDFFLFETIIYVVGATITCLFQKFSFMFCTYIIPGISRSAKIKTITTGFTKDRTRIEMAIVSQLLTYIYVV